MSFTSALQTLQTRGGASRAMIALAIPLSALALGGLHTPVLCAVTAILATAVFVAWFNGSPTRTRLPATVLLFTGLALTAYTALQGMPLPAGLVKTIAPNAFDVWSRSLTPIHEPGPTMMTLSLDPIATRVQVVRGLAYVATFLVALRIADAHGGTSFLSWTIVLSAIALAFAAVLHPMFGMHRVFGVYQPVEPVADRHIAPLLNPNHLGAYLNIGFCLALGMAIGRRREKYRPILAALALLLGATELWVASRGGTLAMIFGAALVILTTRVSRRFAVGSSASAIIPLLAIAVGVGMMVIGASKDVTTELGERDLSKIRLAIEGLNLLPRHALFGVGRGAFEVAFPSVRTDPGYFVVTHPENLPVQWLTEWGLPAALAAGAALAYALRPRVLLVSSTPALGAWAAIATTVAHNLVDFNSEVPAIGIAVAACAAMVVAGRGNSRPGRIHRWAMHPRLVALGIAAVAFPCIAIAIVGWPHELDEDRRALYHDVIEPDLDDGFPERARAALERHPSEPYLPFVASVDASRRGKSVVPWIARTLELAPIYPPAHFVLAQQLAPLAPSQARLEYRLAMTETRNELAGRALINAEKLVKSYEDALEILPPDPQSRADVLTTLARTIDQRLPATRARLDELLAKIDHNAREPLVRQAEAAIADLDLGDAAPWCAERGACAQSGLAAADRLAALEPSTCPPAVLRARLYVASDDAARGLHDLEIAAQNASDSPVCWRWLGQLALQSGNDVYVGVAEQEVSQTGCTVDAECADNLMWVAWIEQQRGSPRQAIKYYVRAHQRAPERVDIVERIATLTSTYGFHAQALDAYRTLQRMTGDPKWGEAAEREKTLVYRDLHRASDAGAPSSAGTPFGGFSHDFEDPFDQDGP